MDTGDRTKQRVAEEPKNDARNNPDRMAEGTREDAIFRLSDTWWLVPPKGLVAAANERLLLMYTIRTWFSYPALRSEAGPFQCRCAGGGLWGEGVLHGRDLGTGSIETRRWRPTSQ